MSDILSSHLHAEFIRSIHQIEPTVWNALCGIDYPFLRHEFFNAMETSGSTTATTGWQPHHLLITHSTQDDLDKPEKNLVAIMPLFIKTHSYGEYVFDWSWADAYHRHGIEYYPKLLNAIPFTPATGARWAIKPNIDQDIVLAFIQKSITQELERIQGSSYHCLFPTKAESDQFASIDSKNHFPWLQRTGYQYHWFNQGYQDFDAFLDTMSSRKKKNIKKERLKVSNQNVTLIVKTHDEITQQDWDDFYIFYQITYLKRSGRQGYLSSTFFPLLAKTMGEHLVMIQAKVNDEAVAAALCFKDSSTLYGRYWGCKENFDSLHFETCYYQGINYAIENQLQRFDPGAQGEHKIQRGFTPIKTYSNHCILHAEFYQAIKNFIGAEKKEVEQYLEEASQLLPFKQTT